MAALATVSEIRFVHVRVAGDTVRTRARWSDVALVVTSLALRPGMSSCEAQHRVIRPNVHDLAPVGFVVAGGALGALEPTLVRIGVAGGALGVEPQERTMAPAISTIVAVFTGDRGMGTFQPPARQSMVESFRFASRPSHELGVASEVLDVATAALLAPVLAPMKTGFLPNSNRQVVVASKTGVGIDPLPRQMTLAAVGIALEIGVIAAQLSGREKLCTGLPGPQRSGGCGDGHREPQNDQGIPGPGAHEKTHRYPYTHATAMWIGTSRIRIIASSR